MNMCRLFFYLSKGRTRKGFTLVELVVVIAILAIGFGSAISMMLSGITAIKKVTSRTTDRYVAMMVTQNIEKNLRFASVVTIYDPALPTQLTDQPNRIQTVNGRVVYGILGSGIETPLTGQEDLPSTYTVTLTMTRTSNKTVGVTVTVTDSTRDALQYPPYTTTTSIAVQNMISASDQVMILPPSATTGAAIAYNILP